MAIGIGVNAGVWTSPFTRQAGTEGLGLLDKVKQVGLGSFGFGREDRSHVDPAKLKAKAERTGLKLVICGAFGPDRDLTHDDASVRENSLNYLTKTIEICAKSGTPVLAGPMYS